MVGHHGRVRKTSRDEGRNCIWVGDCECGWHTQYWAWGAVVGSFFQHLWKVTHA